jgi:AraC-like DNA-binding protein
MKTYEQFNDYYIDTFGKVRSTFDDLHVFRFNELGDNVIRKFGPFKTEYYQFAIGAELSAEVNIFDRKSISEVFSLIVFCPGQIIEWKKTGEWDGYVINVKHKVVADCFANDSNQDTSIVSNLKPIILSINEQQYDLLKTIYELMLSEQLQRKNENLNLIKSLLKVFLQYINRIVKENNVFSEQFEFVKQNQIASEFKKTVLKNCLIHKDVSYYANALGTNLTMLNRYVKKTYNKTPKEFINEMLMLHAKTMLSKPNSSVKEVAYDLNFDDYSHFVKFFKKMEGISPAEYLKG